ncbi:hypothetical protein BJV78DRAFT_464840 [Lactifluus subvellereus]|nr:hypothetical protein BJV78DRAFT_464840 [Lactifluus subvellereus]
MIDKLSEDVVLVIFDSCRQGSQHQDNYEDDWNGKDGWFKLAHVCQNWRRIVLASPSHLHLQLVFTPHMPTSAIVPGRLPPLPILINYGTGVRTDEERNRVIFALKDRNRVWGSTLEGQTPTCRYSCGLWIAHFQH